MVVLWLAAGFSIAALVYALVVVAAWLRYGRPARPSAGESDPLLDGFMPEYEIAERHHVRVKASSEVTLLAARMLNLQKSAIVRAIFRARELFLGARASDRARPVGLLAEMLSIGWGVLVESPGREVVVGAVTQPWLADVVFRALSPETFRGFREPGYVKIAWTLRADPGGEDWTTFRTETRAVATDKTARARFRWYWARFSPGIILIRWMLLRLLKADAKAGARRAQAAG
jgi:hypothetical protein